MKTAQIYKATKCPKCGSARQRVQGMEEQDPQPWEVGTAQYGYVDYDECLGCGELTDNR